MMDKGVFLNAPPQPLPFPWSGLTCNSDQSFLDSISSVDQHSHFESTLTSMASSQAATGEAFALPPPASATPAASLLSSSLQLPVLDQIDMPDLRRSVPLSPAAAVPSLAADPGFAERAARLSCFGSRSFNGRASPFGLHNAESTYRSGAPLMVNGRLQRVSSSPSLKQGGSPVQSRKYSSQGQVEMRPAGGIDSGSDKKWSEISGSGVNSNEESSVSEQIPSGETGSKTSTELNSCKRKGGSRGNSAKGVEGEDVGNVKRSKPNGSGDEAKGGSNNEKEKEKGDQKAAEPPKDYIHVRARRGQATDSHSLAERVRREKISERMKLLQGLVPGCNKVTGKALMLDEIINYVKSLQRQVEFLSMKLASVNPGLDFNLENLVPKDMFQQNTALPHQMYPPDSSEPALYHPQPQYNAQQLHGNDVSEAPLSQCPVNPVPLDVTRSYNLGVQLPCVDGFSEILPQFAALSEDDLHTIVQMGFAKNAADNLHGDDSESVFTGFEKKMLTEFNILISDGCLFGAAPNQTSSMKLER